MSIRNVLLSSLVMCAGAIQAHKLDIINDNSSARVFTNGCSFRRNIRVLEGTYAQDLKVGQVHGKTLRKLDAHRIEPGKHKKIGSKYEAKPLYVYEKNGKNSYQLIAIIEQNGGVGQEVAVSLSELKADQLVCPAADLLKVMLK